MVNKIKTQIRHGVIGQNPDGSFIWGDYVAAYTEGKEQEFYKSCSAIEKFRYNLKAQAREVLRTYRF